MADRDTGPKASARPAAPQPAEDIEDAVATLDDPGDPGDPGDRGTLTVRGRAAGRIVERAALEVPGVVRHTTRRGAAITGRELPRAVVDMTPAQPNVRVDIALVWPSPVAALCRRVREQVVADLDRLTGRAPSRVDIEVAELVVPRPDTDQARSDTR